MIAPGKRIPVGCQDAPHKCDLLPDICRLSTKGSDDLVSFHDSLGNLALPEQLVERLQYVCHTMIVPRSFRYGKAFRRLFSHAPGGVSPGEAFLRE